ncbi:MAG: alpha/beta hydrolase, partial [Verrucomicrobia bacterium]
RRRAGFLDRLVLLNTGAFPSRNIPKRIALCRLPWIGALLVRGCNGFSGAAVHMTTVRKLPREVARGYLFPHRSWATRIAVHRFVRDIPLGPGHRTQAEIEAIAESLREVRRRPVKIIWGERDWCFDRTFLEEFRRRLPEAEVLALPDAGHWLLEDAGERIAAEVRAFLTRA